MELKEKIRKIVREILQQKALEEVTATGNIAGYNTPNVFKRTGDTPDPEYINRLNTGTGYTLVENRYQELRKDERTPNQKIGEGIRNIRKQLQEIEKFITWYSKIKSESGLDREAYWKRTHRHLNKIRERLNTISQKITKL